MLVQVRLSDAATGVGLAIDDLPSDAVAEWRLYQAGTGGQSQQRLDASSFTGETTLRQAIIRQSALEDGAQYTVQVDVTSATGGWSVRASVTLETNAPPSSGYLEASAATVRLLDQNEGLSLRAVGWTDDVNQTPLAYRFGYYRLEAVTGAAVAAGELSDA